MKLHVCRLLVAAATLAPASAMAASPALPVTVKGAVAACAYYPGECTDASGKREAAGAVDLPLGPLASTDDPRARATIQSSLSASYGFLEVEGIATAWSHPLTKPGDEYARGIANGTLTWIDRLAVESETLPAGTPVRMKAHLRWQYENRTPGGHFQAGTSLRGANRFSLAADEEDEQQGQEIFKSVEFPAVVGESIDLAGSMTFVAQAIASGRKTHELRFRAFGEVRFESLTSGATFRSASGAAYR